MKRFVLLLVALLNLMLLGCGQSAPNITLPGQNKPASRILTKAVNDVQELIGVPIHFYELKGTGRGLTGQWTEDELPIWLNPTLEQDVQEAVAAHELAHILQAANGYHGIEVPVNTKGIPLSPFDRLATEVNALILDRGADLWAEQRGFKVKDELQSDYIPAVLASIDSLKEQGHEEGSDWEAYHDWVMLFVKAIRNGESLQTNMRFEFSTQKNAVTYAKHKLRLSPYGLFSEVETALWQVCPIASEMGEDIYQIVQEYGITTKDECNTTMIQVIEYLKIPPPIFKVRDYTTGAIVWP